ncbi:solute carrier family 22 member 7 [Rhipicephalus sanguineus]|uniref:Organic cation/carnitine transporter n=1 Tax=Rhipicephalus sanguineus TaxID=34632 RepID=A0A9D4PVH0_RHISA|nr:solute carrier family 22 member 7 [Rhipicephalus sanguineus]KAH7956550.1 hypothetical protein HPB52_010624 [Rhipicephalus sanguineus]
MELFSPQRLARCDLRTSESFDCQEGFGYGVFQKRLFVLLILAAFSLICQTSIVTLVFSDVDHWCKRPRGFNISAAEWKNIAIPLEADGRLSQCRVYERCMPPVHLNLPNRQRMDSAMQAQPDWWFNECLNATPEAANDTREISCKEWEYDVTVADSTVVSTWDLVCHRRLIRIAVVALQYAGAVLFLVTSGMYADSLSRRSCLVASAAALLTTTVCTFLATTYYLYALARFLAGGITAVNEVFSVVIPFEVTTHVHRPQQVILWHLVGVLLAEFWEILIRGVPMFWSLKQLVFLAPTALLLPVSFTAPESPRWLVAKGRLREAETVMMQAAEDNGFPFQCTAALMDKLREQVKSRTCSPTASDKEILDSNSLRRRALAMFFAYFSMTFSYYVAVFATAPIPEAWIPYGVVAATLLACGAMHVLLTDIALVTVMNTCFVMIAVVDCLLSAAAGAGVAMVRNILSVLSRGVSLAMLIHILVFVMELFPSAVRSGALCWVFASGRVGAVFASVTFVLQLDGREDVAFAVAALLLFVSLLVIRVLPRATMVEQAKEAKIGACSRWTTMKHMRRTLEQPTDHKTKSGSNDLPQCRQSFASNAASTGSSKDRKSRKSLASNTDSSRKPRRHDQKFSQKLGLPKSVPMSMTQADADIG